MAVTQSGNLKHELIALKRVSLYLPFIPHRTRAAGLSNQVGGKIERKGGHAHVVALKGINLSLNRGDRLAIFGHNGAGKSSLLRVMAGIFEPSAGVCSIRGKVSALLSSNVGISLMNSGRQSIRQAAGMFEVPPREMAVFEQSVIEFSELGDFIDVPVSAYSAGMRARLGFAIISTLDPDILLVDEVLSAGDQGFAERAQRRILDMIERSHALVVSSHSAELMRMFCNRGVWLERGEIKSDGPFESVWSAYYESVARGKS
jgi:ABC-type polysaccharide/polyol phosphate transport system ATPase subunit